MPEVRNNRVRGTVVNDSGRRLHSKNKQWVADQSGGRSRSSTPAHVDGERWERGGHRGGRGRGVSRGGARKFPNASLVVTQSTPDETTTDGGEDDEDDDEDEEHEDELVEELDVEAEPVFESDRDRDAFYHELVKAREAERKKAIAEGKMDDPQIPKRLEDAISMVGTCMDMCPRFERWRREREGTLYQWEMIPGTKRVNHKLAVKQYERAAGDKTLPSDLRPPKVLKKTLDYLFRDLLPRGGFSPTFNFIRDRSRAVRNDFTMQHESGPLAIECHDRCARFHILALHFERGNPQFSVMMEEQQLMYTLQSLKEFYEDQRGRYSSPTELEMRVYHRLIHIRDQQERREDIPAYITEHPVFKLTTKFRLHVQAKSAPISKTSALVVDAAGMQIFGELAAVLREQGSVVMIYLVACILERLFGKDTIDDIEAIRGELSIPDIIDGISTSESTAPVTGVSHVDVTAVPTGSLDIPPSTLEESDSTIQMGSPLKPSATEWLTTNFGSKPTTSAVLGQPSKPPVSAFGATTGMTRPGTSQPPVSSAFANLSSVPNAFGGTVFGQSGTSKSVFGGARGPAQSVFGSAPTAASSTPSTSSNPFVGPSSIGSPSPFGGFSSTTSNSLFGAPSSSPFAKPTTGSTQLSQVQTTPNDQLAANAASPAPSSVANSPLKAMSFSAPQTTLNPSAPTFTPISKLPSQPVHPPDQAPVFLTTPSRDAVNRPDTKNATFSQPQLFPSLPLAGERQVPLPAQIASQPPLSGPSKRSSRTPSASVTPPPRPTINTDPAMITTDLLRTPLSQPPPLSKQQPISLPSTPTLSSHPTTSQPYKPLLAFPKGVLQASLLTPTETLSPLHIPSPTASKLHGNFNSVTKAPESPLKEHKPSLGPRPVTRSDGLPASSGKSKEKDPALDLDTLATAFLNKGLIVKECFERWQKRTTDRAAWVEACRRSDAYRQKVHRQRLAAGSPITDRKRRPSSGISPETPRKKRVRKRVSSEYQPRRTDEELAQRFKENHKDHERRWARGTFLRVLKEHIDSKANGSLPLFGLWLSMNPDNDGTAIWLERKFDIPNSGQWESESIFSIPLCQGSSTSSPFPSIIIFERTPLGDVPDELERKYRVLDDCSRLRDLIETLPPKRRYAPSLLIISWTDGGHTDSSSDFLDMVSKLREEKLESYCIFSITTATTDLDRKFEEALRSLTLDLDGKLIQSLTLRRAFMSLEKPWKAFISEWMDNCSSTGEFDWIIFGQLVEGAISLLNTLAHCVVQITTTDALSDPFPRINVRRVIDSESAYDSILSWLDDDAIRDAAYDIRKDFLSHRNMGREFPSGAFFEHVCALALDCVERSTGKESTSFDVPVAELKATLDQFQNAVQSSADHLQKIHNSRIRRSPKRRSLSDDESILTSSPSATKRARLSLSNGSMASPESSPVISPQVNGRISPSPSATPSVPPDDKSPFISVAMLRALTQDVKKKYGANR